MTKIMLAIALATLGLLGLATATEAQTSTERRAELQPTSQRVKMRYHHRSRGPTRRVVMRGGYSYTYRDVMSPWRDPVSLRQTPSGPFDSGFFFDSPVAPHGGQSPYLH